MWEWLEMEIEQRQRLEQRLKEMRVKCKEPGCDRRARLKGYCNWHFKKDKRWLIHEDIQHKA